MKQNYVKKRNHLLIDVSGGLCVIS